MITINHALCGGSDSSDFPVLISGTYDYLATTAHGGKVRNSSGYDIIFTSDALGTNLLNWEIETYSPTDGKVNFWVKIPNVSHSADTTFYDSSTAGAATIANSGTLSFNDGSSAGSAGITNTDTMYFNSSSTAGRAIIVNNAGNITFYDSSKAGTASR